MQPLAGKFVLLVEAAMCVCAVPTFSQVVQEETLSGTDRHETGPGLHGHRFINWMLDPCQYCSP
jgi:hypothetical protein